MGTLSRPIKSAAASYNWARKHRTVQTLLRFARTEAGGAVDIARAAHAATTPELVQHLVRHAGDEERHAKMFRDRAREVFGAGHMPLPDSPGTDLLPAAAEGERGSLSLSDHGFLPSDHFAKLGEVGYVAMLYLAEQQAAADFQLHHQKTARRDPGTAAVFESILRDERYHVAYTRAQLDAWIAEGRGSEVRKALRAMRWQRFKTEWLQLSGALGDTMSRVFLSAIYLTLFLPFGLIGRAVSRRSGWRIPHRSPGHTVEELRQQA